MEMENLVDTVGGLLDGGKVRQVSSLVREDEGSTRRAIKTAIPVSIAGLASQAHSEAGARSLLQTLQSGRYPHLDPEDLDEALSDPTAANRVALSGESFLGRVFGARLDGVLDGMAGAAGVSRSAAAKLLGLATPLILSLVSKRAASEHLDAHGLAGFLDQQEHLAAGYLPDRMYGLLGGTRPAMEETLAAERVPRRAGVPYRRAAHRRGIWPWLVAALVIAGGLGWWANRRTRQEIADKLNAISAPAPIEIVAPPPPGPPAATEPPPAERPATTAPAVAPPPAALAPVVAVAAGAVGPFQLAAEQGTGPLPQRFVVQGLDFQTDSAALRPETTRVLDDIANVMTANPGVAIRAEGHTDNTGVPDANLALSTDRANAVKDYLVSQGIAADRIATAGLGSEQPIAPNDTAEGRTINRRTEIVLLQR